MRTFLTETGWGMAALLVAAVLSGCDKPVAPSAAPETTTSTVTNTSSSIPAAFTKLLGSWQRPDGGYILEISNISPDRQVTAKYLNPAEIHISKAVVLQDSEGVKLFVELRDVNYPGCTYSLKYDSAHDQLYGDYFQAAMRETFDVTFARLPSR